MRHTYIVVEDQRNGHFLVAKRRPGFNIPERYVAVGAAYVNEFHAVRRAGELNGTEPAQTEET